MLLAEKPPLQDVYLEHYGVKGMKWGVRKKRPDEAERKKRFGPKAKKIAIASVAIIGAAAVAYALNQSGGVKIGAGGLTNSTSDLYSKVTAGKKAAEVTFKKPVKMADLPSPQAMMAQARMAGVRTQFNNEGNRRLTDATWRASANLASEARKMGAAQKLPSLDDVRKKLDDPSYVWEL